MKKLTTTLTVLTLVAALNASAQAPRGVNAKLDIDYSNVTLWRGLPSGQDSARATLDVKSGGLFGTPISVGATGQITSQNTQFDPKVSRLGVNTSVDISLAKELVITPEVGVIRNDLPKVGVFTEAYASITFKKLLMFEYIAIPTVRYVYNTTTSKSGAELELARPIYLDKIHTTVTPFAGAGVFENYTYVYPGIRADVAVAKNLSVFGSTQLLNSWNQRIVDIHSLAKTQPRNDLVFNTGVSFNF